MILYSQEEAHFQSRADFKLETGHFPDEVGLLQLRLQNSSGDELQGIARETHRESSREARGETDATPRRDAGSVGKSFIREPNMMYQTERAVVWKRPLMTTESHVYPEQGETVYALACKKAAKVLGHMHGNRHQPKKKVIPIYSENCVEQALAVKEDKLGTVRRGLSFAESLVGDSPSDGRRNHPAAALQLEDVRGEREDGRSSACTADTTDANEVFATPQPSRRAQVPILQLVNPSRSRSRSRSRDRGSGMAGYVDSEEEARVNMPSHWRKVLSPKAMFADQAWKHSKKQIAFAKKCVGRIFSIDSLEASGRLSIVELVLPCVWEGAGWGTRVTLGR